MKRVLSVMFLTLFSIVPLAADERRNLSTEDVIAGFEQKKLFYFELLLQNGKYTRGFNKCLGDRPADPKWIRQHCKKNPDFKHTFQCAEDSQLTHIWFIYENAAQCEDVRGLMKTRMDALSTK